MSKSLSQKILVCLCGAVIVLVLFCVRSFNNFSAQIFKLSPHQVAEALADKISPCETIATCELITGDVLIRRYITDRTWLANKVFHPYFTHSAIYLGNDEIVEAAGKEKNREDDVRILKLSQSDWMNDDIESWVVIRPKNISSVFPEIKNDLLEIADGRNYIFGFGGQGEKRTTCADLIFQELYAKNIIKSQEVPGVIAPDYLFWITSLDTINFSIAGYRF